MRARPLPRPSPRCAARPAQPPLSVVARRSPGRSGRRSSPSHEGKSRHPPGRQGSQGWVQSGPALDEEAVMAVTAYILIQTEVGQAAQVAEEVGGIDGIVSADDVTGPY